MIINEEANDVITLFKGESGSKYQKREHESCERNE